MNLVYVQYYYMFSTIILSVCSFVCLIVEVFSASICISYHVSHIVVQICTPGLLFKLYHFSVIIQTISFQGYYSNYIFFQFALVSYIYTFANPNGRPKIIWDEIYIKC